MTRVDKIAHQTALTICIIFAVVGSFAWIIDYILPPYYSDVKYLIACAVAPTLLYTLSEITCVGIAITRRTTLTIWITVAALTSNILLCTLLVPIYGATGAIISNALSYLIFFIGRTEFSAKVWRQIDRKKIYVYVFLFVLAGIYVAFAGPELVVPQIFIWISAMLIIMSEWIKSFK